MEKEIRFKAFITNKGNNMHRKRYNYFKRIKSIRHLVYSDDINEKVTMKHNKREMFGYSLSNFKSKYVNNEYE
jgi:hypothetical protein